MLAATGLRNEYPSARGPLAILDGVTFSLEAGQSLCVMGPSGSGKSTLLNILGTLEPPTSGTVTFFGRDLAAFPERELAPSATARSGWSSRTIACSPQCSVLENVMLPTMVGPPGDHEAHARDLILELHAREKTVLVLVTHSLELAARFPDRRRLAPGGLESLPVEATHAGRA